VKRIRLPDGTRLWAAGRLEAAFLHEEILEREAYSGCERGLGPGSVVIDAGANIGLFALWVLRRAPAARLLCFEPVPETFRILERNAREHLPGARLFSCGLASFDGSAAFSTYRGASGWSTRFPEEAAYRDALFRVLNQGEQAGPPALFRLLGRYLPGLQRRIFDRSIDRILASRRVLDRPVRRLGTVIEEEGLERIDLLKIDAEGSEPDILEGVGEEHWERIARVVLELHDVEDARDRAVSHLEERGYRVESRQDPAYRGTGFVILHASRAAGR
jgi:hypothetical protein